MKFINLAFLLMGLVLHAQSDNLKEFTLKDAQQFALKSNLRTASADLEIESAEETIKEYRAIGLPQVNGSIGWTHYFDIPTQIIPDFITPSVDERLQDYDLVNESELLPINMVGVPAQFGTKNNVSAAIEASQLLYDGRYNLGMKAARLFVERATVNSSVEYRDLKFDVANAYFLVLVAEEGIGIFEKSQADLEKTLFETKELYNNGFIEQLDVDRLQLSLSNVAIEVDGAKKDLEIAQKGLNFHLGLDTSAEVLLTDNLEDFITQNIDVISADADVSNRIEDELFELQDKFDDLDIRQVKVGYLPTVVGFVNHTQSFQADNLKLFKEEWFPSTLAGLQVNIPIFDGFTKKSQIQQRVIKQKINQNNREVFNDGFDVEVTDAKIRFQKSLDQLNNQKDNLALSQKIYNISSIKYKEGLGSSLELNNADAERNRTQILYLRALHQMVQAINQLNFALGN